MFVELIDLLRCPRPHEDSWLVASADETRERHIVRGALGCPVCMAEYPIRDAVVDFGVAPVAATSAWTPSPDDAVRAAAFLDLVAPNGAIVLGGVWQAVAGAVADMAAVRVLLLDPPSPLPLRAEVSAMHGGGVIPVAPASLRGVALDAATADAARLTAAVHALRPGGRLVAPANAPFPDGVTELARDDAWWVAERAKDAVATQPIRLRRA